jgi:pyruvate/2-oxoglutarate/acetoin dehydrogenase E1 component
VVDPRTLVPFDWELVADSVRRTSRLLVVHEAPLTAGPGAEIAARAADELFADLDAPVRRVAGADVPIPQNMDLEQYCYPQVTDIVAAARELIAW